MPRQARLDAPGALHHVMVRGIEKRRIVEDGKDRRRFTSRLGNAASSKGMTIYAWSLMSNHAHILLRSGSVGLPAFMRAFLTGYAIDYNHRHHRHGHLFQNRYKSIVCEEDVYFRESVRYIHLNPIRAGLIKGLDQLERYPWCGHSVLMGQVEHGWQDRSYVLSWFGRKENDAVRAYHEFIGDGVALGSRPELVGGGLIRSAGGWSEVKSRRGQREGMVSDERILGGGQFVEKVLEEAEERVRHQLPMDRRLGEARDLIDRVCSEAGLSVEELGAGSRRGPVSRMRRNLLRRIVMELGLTQAEAARLPGVTTSAVAKSLMRAQRALSG
jgi:putative transposase